MCERLGNCILGVAVFRLVEDVGMMVMKNSCDRALNVMIQLVCFVGFVGLVANCNSGTFIGQSRKQGVEPPAPTPSPTPVPTKDDKLSLTCDPAETSADKTLDYKAPAGTIVTVSLSGQLCYAVKNQLTVLFVVDFSGSMGKHQPTSGGATLDGNDPQTSGSCGRLRAASAIVDKLRREHGANDTIKVGFVPFAGNVLSDRIVAPTDLDTFSGMLTKNHFCQYVIQNSSFGVDPINPGGIYPYGGVDASTNYRAAFETAGTELQGMTGRKVIYFISDGEPTSGGSDPTTAGLQAAKTLESSISDLTVNGLLLGTEGAQAQSVMEQIAGQADRVRIADNADQLASEILKFPDVTFQAGTAQGELVGRPDAEKSLTLTLQPVTNKTGVWAYETSKFVLLGEPGKTTENKVHIKAQSSDGSTHESLVTIRFTEE